MTVNRLCSALGLSLSVVALCACLTNKKIVWALAFVVTLILFYLLTKIEDYIRGSDGAVLNKILYYLPPNKQQYIITYAEAVYKYISKNEMTYSKHLEIKSKRNGLTGYEDKYNWSSYSKNIEVLPIYTEQTIKLLGHKDIWELYEVDFHKRLCKGETISTGAKITNLIDELGMAKPFLALSTENKIQERVMSVIIPQELKSKNAFFEVYPSNDYKKCIKRQPLTYDSNIGGYKRAISFPRQGWIYAIVWEWEENN